MTLRRIMLRFATAPYLQQASSWPSAGRHILANYDDESIIVYQAYNDAILADAATKANNFHSAEVLRAGYSPERMSWIKTNFLWMIYRSRWAEKPNQTRILAMKISRSGFEEILLNASTKGASSVRLQWDPDHAPNYDKSPRRAIQLGLRGDMLQKLSREFLLDIHDVTDFVREQAKNVSESCESLVVPVENVYHCLNALAASHVGVDPL